MPLRSPAQTSRPGRLAPTAAGWETFSRDSSPGAGNAGTVLGSGVLTMGAIWLPSGYTVNNIAYLFGTTGSVTATNWWFGLFSSARVLLATTADQLTATITASTITPKAIANTAAGAASSFTTTYEGVHYLGVVVAATTPPSVISTVTASTLNNLPPITCGTSNTGQTAPPAFPFTANAITVTSSPMYAYVN